MLAQVVVSQSPESLALWLHIWEDVAMGAAIELRSDFNGATLGRLARRATNANQARRLLALAEWAYRLCVIGSCGSIPAVPMG